MNEVALLLVMIPLALIGAGYVYGAMTNPQVDFEDDTHE